MTHIRGSIDKVYEVLTKGYAISPVQTASMCVTSANIAGLSLVGFYVINIPGTTYKNGYMKKISVTCNNIINLMEVYLEVRTISTGATQMIWRSFFVNNGEWDLDDTKILNTEEYLLTFGNYAAGAVHFTANISYIEV